MTSFWTEEGRSHAAAWASAVAAVFLLAGCAAPRSVSTLGEVQEASKQGAIVLVPVTAETLPPPSSPLQAAFPAEFTSADRFDHSVLGRGDQLSVRVWESGTPPVFGSTSGAGADLGVVTMDDSGRVYIPYAGAIPAAGRTVADVRTAITRKLSTVVLRPQVDVRLADRRNALVSVQGDAAKTGSFPITQGRSRLGELLAEVAPNQKVPEMLRVSIRRQGQVANVRLSDVYANPALDIALRPGDSIILNEQVEIVTVLGAAGVQGQIRIPERDFSLISAFGQAKGISDERADPRAVFVMRAQDDPAKPPLVYHFDFRRPESISLANRFVMRDGDAILVSNAPFAHTQRMLTSFAQGLSGLRSAVTVVP